MKKARVLLLLPLCATIMVSCAVYENDASGMAVTEVIEETEESDVMIDDLQAELMSFASKTAAAVLSEREGNRSYSPLSLYFALSLASIGTEGDTRIEMLELLGTEGRENAYIASQAAGLYERLYTDRDNEKLSIANSLWLEKAGVFNDIYTGFARESYNAELFSVSFTDAGTGGRMGEWIAKNTGGKLSPTITPDPQWLMVIINTVYFKSQWVTNFPISATSADVFHGYGGDITCGFMRQTCNGSYISGEGYTRVSLALNNGAMYFVLPDEGTDISELLTSDRLTEILDTSEKNNTRIAYTIPKFTLKTDLELREALEGLGVSKAFDMAKADFSGMTPMQAYITAVKQQSYVSIDEYGVEAAAFTAFTMGTTSVQTNSPKPFVLNRPFIYFITGPDGITLFVGVVENPLD